MTELMNHQILIILINKNRVLLQSFLHLDQLIKILLCFQWTVQENVDFENSTYMKEILLEDSIVIGLAFLIMFLHSLDDFVIVFQCIGIFLFRIVFGGSLVIFKPGLLSYQFKLLLGIKCAISWGEMISIRLTVFEILRRIESFRNKVMKLSCNHDMLFLLMKWPFCSKCLNRKVNIKPLIK